MWRDKPAAIKEFLPCYPSQFLIEEMDGMSSLQTGHLVRNYAAYVGEERQVQVMELLDGTLWDHLDRSPTPLPIDEVVSLAMDIGIGIWQLHTRGIVHRDIKPENILTWQDSSGNVHAKIYQISILPAASPRTI